MSVFRFKHFSIQQAQAAMKVGTDSMLLGSFIETENHTKALDIGTGTGVLSLMLAQQNPNLDITAMELDEAAFQEAEKNVKNSNYSAQIKVLYGDFLTSSFPEQFDLIFSNPPFFENSSKSDDEQKNKARHTDSLPMKALIDKVSEILTADGDFWIILPPLNFDAFVVKMHEKGFFLNRELFIYGKREQLVRKIGAFSRKQTERIQSNFVIRNADGTYTEQYRNQTIDFHFNKI